MSAGTVVSAAIGYWLGAITWAVAAALVRAGRRP